MISARSPGVGGNRTAPCCGRGLRAGAAALFALSSACASPRYSSDETRDANTGASSQAEVTPPGQAPRIDGGASSADAAISASGQAALDAQGLAAPDAQAPELPQTTQFPSWAQPLLGVYAAQSYSFSRDNVLNLVSRTEDLSLVEIVRVGEGARLRSRLCRLFATSSSDELRFVDPSGLKEVVRAVTFGDDMEWSTDAEPIGYGYDRELPAECVGKQDQSIPRPSFQSWQPGTTCRCPISAAAEPRSDDCRVLDPDKDGNPGVTYTEKSQDLLIGAIINSTLYTVYASRTHAVHGIVRSDRMHFAERYVDEVAFLLGCSASSCPKLGDISRPCTSGSNSTHFVPLPGAYADWTCEKLLTQSATLFPAPPPVSPMACSEQVLTDDPTRK